MNLVTAIDDVNLSKALEQRLKCVDDKYYIMYIIGANLGLRISDIIRLKARHIKQGTRIIEKKTKKEKFLNFPDEVLAMVRAYIKAHGIRPSQYIIYRRITDKDNHLSRVQAYKIINREANELKMKSIGTHSMRKTFAVNHYKKHKDLIALQKAMNHKYLTTTLCYLLGVKNVNEIDYTKLIR